MNRPIIGLVALGAVAGTVVWFAATTRELRRDARPVSAEVAAESVAEVARADSTLLAAPPASVNDEPRPPSTRQAAGGIADELARAHWVEGQVLFPAGTPADEEVLVIARGHEFAGGELQGAQFERDGRFRVAFSEKTTLGWLDVEARYLYLEGNKLWTATGTGPVVLEPRLGGRIVGIVVPPLGADVDARGKIELRRVPGTQKTTHSIAEDLGFEIRAQPAGDHELSYEHGVFVASPVRIAVEAGTTLTVQIPLQRGLTLTGRVVDGSGRGLAGVEVRAIVLSERSIDEGLSAIDMRRPLIDDALGESDTDGAFQLTGLTGGGTTSIQARKDGYGPVVQSLGPLATGEAYAGIELVMERARSGRAP